MKKLLFSAYIAFLLAPTAASPATIVETFAVPLPIEVSYSALLTSNNLTPLLARLTTCR